MKPHRFALFALGLALPLAATANAQRPELTGTWIASPAQNPGTVTAAASPVFGARFAMKSEPGRVTITRPAGEMSTETVLPTDGTRALTPVAAPPCMAERTVHETAGWEGDTMVVTVVGMTPAGGGTPLTLNNRTLFRRLSGDQLLVEATMSRQGQRNQVSTVYTRTADALPPLRAALPVAGVAATIDRVAWIGAMWAGTTNGLTTEERWTPPASGSMIAVSRTLRGTSLAAFELICIAERAGRLVYFAMPSARAPATQFVATDVTATSVTFENPAHDYPKLIRYAQTPDGSLETTIAGAAGSRSQKVVLQKGQPTPSKTP